MRLLYYLTTAATLVFPFALSNAEDLTTLDGITFTNITEIDKYPKQVYFTCNSNRIGLSITNLPEWFRAKHQIMLQTNSIVANADADGLSRLNDDLFLNQHLNSQFSCRTNISFDVTNKFTGVRWHGCSLEVNPKGFEFYVGSGRQLENRGKHTLKEELDFLDSQKNTTQATIYFRFGEEKRAEQIFKRYLEWEETAVANNAVPFNKELAYISNSDIWQSKRSFEFMWQFGEARLILTALIHP